MKTFRANVYANGAAIGQAELTLADAGTGTYQGTFHPDEGYAAVRPVVLELMRRAWPRQQTASEPHLREAYRQHDALEIEVRTAEGEVLHPSGVYIEDAGGVWMDPSPRIEVAGMPDAEVRRHFAGG